MNEWINAGWLSSHISRLHGIVHGCTYRKMGPRIKKMGNEPAQFLADSSKCIFQAWPIPACERDGEMPQNVHRGSHVGEGRAITSQWFRLQDLELFSLELLASVQLWPPHSDRFSKAESTDVVCFIPEGNIKTIMGSGLWERSWGREPIRRQISAEKEQLSKNQGYSERE